MSFCINTSHIPELSFINNWIKNNSGEFTAIVNQYEDIIGKLFTLNEHAFSSIGEAKALMRKYRVKQKNASNIDTLNFLQKVHVSEREEKTIIKDMFKFDPMVLLKLESMLENGSKIAKDNLTKPSDGDLIWDKVIWGHTQAKKDIDRGVLVHFCISHYISQYMNVKLSDFYKLKEKDDFLAVMTDVIIYLESKKPGQEIYKIWSKAKVDGGLGWINNEQLSFYE